MKLNRIPPVAVKVFEDGDCAIGLNFWRPDILDTLELIGLVVAVEVVGRPAGESWD